MMSQDETKDDSPSPEFKAYSHAEFRSGHVHLTKMCQEFNMPEGSAKAAVKCDLNLRTMIRHIPKDRWPEFLHAQGRAGLGAAFAQ